MPDINELDFNEAVEGPDLNKLDFQEAVTKVEEEDPYKEVAKSIAGGIVDVLTTPQQTQMPEELVPYSWPPADYPDEDPYSMTPSNAVNYSKRVGDRFLGKATDAIAYPFEKMFKGFDLISKVAGSSIMWLASPWQNLAGFESTYDKMVMEDLNKRIAREKETGIRDKDIFKEKFLPASMADVLRRPTQYSLDSLENYLNNKGYGNAADVIGGMKGITSEGMGLLAEFMIPLPKVGTLTKEGQIAAKAGKLEQGLAQRIAKGQAKGFALESAVPLLGSGEVPIMTKKASQELLYKAQSLAVAAENSAIGQQFKMFTTGGTLDNITEAGIDSAIRQRVVDSRVEPFVQMYQAKSKQMGIDLDDPAVYDDWVRYVENPSHYTPKLVKKADAESLYKELQTNLDNLRAYAKQNGVEINDKFDKIKIRDVLAKNGFAERYLPRYWSEEALAWKKAQKIADDISDAELEGIMMGAIKEGGKKTSLAFLKKRSDLNTTRLNQIAEEATGIKNFFERDPIRAYARKAAEIEKAVIKKQLYDGIVKNSARTYEDWVAIRNAAKARVDSTRAAGQIPSLQDVKLAKINLNQLEKVGDAGEDINRVLNAANKTDIDYRALLLPKSDADFVRGLINAPSQNDIEEFMGSYMRMWKGAVFFNPGFYMRNTYENASRAIQVGLTPLDLFKAEAEFLHGWKSGKASSILKEFDEMTGKTGVTVTQKSNIGSVPEKIIKPRGAEDQVKPLYKKLWESMARNNKLANVMSDGMDKVSKNPLWRGWTNLNDGTERGIKYAYYKKLRKEGWEKEAAYKEVASKFISYDLIRNRTVKLQNYVPFANFMAKNLETTASLFLKNPRGAHMWVPGGAFQRAVENWSEWDPDQIDEYKKLFGDYYSDRFLGPILPGKDAMVQEKDYIKNFLNSWLNPDGNLAGYQTWANLPSNYSALKSMNPLKYHEMMGPIVKMAWPLMGKDPVTGVPLRGASSPEYGATEKAFAMLGQGAEAFYPDRYLSLLRATANKMWPEMSKSLANMGLSEDWVKTLLGDKDAEKYYQDMDKAMATYKTLMLGNFTKLNVDIVTRQLAILKATERDFDALMQQYNRGGKQTDQLKFLYRDRLFKTRDKLIKLINIKDEYEQIVEKIGGTPEAIIEEDDTPQEEDAPPSFERDDEPTPQEMESDELSAIMYEYGNRQPAMGAASPEAGIFQRSNELMQKYAPKEAALAPQENVTGPAKSMDEFIRNRGGKTYNDLEPYDDTYNENGDLIDPVTYHPTNQPDSELPPMREPQSIYENKVYVDENGKVHVNASGVNNEAMAKMWQDYINSVTGRELDKGGKLPQGVQELLNKQIGDQMKYLDQLQYKDQNKRKIDIAAQSVDGRKPASQDYGLFDGKPELKELWESLPDDKKDEALKEWLEILKKKDNKK